MSLTLNALEIISAFFPGLLVIIVVGRIAPFDELKAYEWLIYSYLSGMIVHLMVFAISPIITWITGNYYATFLTHYDTYLKLYPSEFFYCVLFSLIVGYFIGVVRDRQLVSKLLNRFHICKNTENRIFDTIMKEGIPQNKSNNISEKERALEKSKWVRIFDNESHLYYDGYIRDWEISNTRNSILLTDVEVYKLDTDELYYNTPAIYIPNGMTNYIIEFAHEEFTNFEEVKKCQNLKDILQSLKTATGDLEALARP